MIKFSKIWLLVIVVLVGISVAVVFISKLYFPSALGDIGYKQVQEDASVSAVIDSSQLLDNGNLVVKFHHNSDKEEPISIIGHVQYDLDKTTAKPGETVTLTVYNWATEYFELKIGQQSDTFGFGSETESLDNNEPVLRELQRQGIEKTNVVLEKDYGKLGEGTNPYSKTYKDIESGKRIMVVSGLPMVDDTGMPISVGWDVVGNEFVAKENTFEATVTGNEVEVIVKNDQLTFRPQLFLNGAEQTPTGPTLLAVDPVNANYQNNVLEWDYGIAKRRLRLIEGSILGSWVFDRDPKGEIRIKYNQVGDYRLKLGQFGVSDDEEVITPEQFDALIELHGYPVMISDSAPYYPDATAVDGDVSHYVYPNLNWAGIRAGAGGSDTYPPDYTSLTFYAYDFHPNANNSGLWERLTRGIILFNTAGLPDDGTITGATLSIYGSAKADPNGHAPSANVYAAAPVANTSLAAGDFCSAATGCTGTDRWANPLVAFSSPIAYASQQTGDPGTSNDFVFNASGLAAISKTGISKFGTRNANYDVSGTVPTWYANWSDAYLIAWSSEKGTGYKPQLLVTYTPPVVAPTVSTQAASSIGATGATLNGNIDATGNENASERGFDWSAESNWLWGWLYRKKITIDETKIDSTLTDFPVLVKLTSSNFDFSKALSTGYDIRFTDSSGTSLLKYERDRYSQASSYAEYWVKIPSVSGTANTDFYIYYGKSDAPEGADPTNVWDANTVARYSTQDLTASTIKDSTASPENGTKKAASEPIEADGKIGKAQSFDGTNDYITMGNVLDFTTGNFSVSAWVKKQMNSKEKCILNKGKIASAGWQISVSAANGIGFAAWTASWAKYANSASSLNTYLQDANWHHIAATANRTSNDYNIYVDGEEVTYSTNNSVVGGFSSSDSISNSNPFGFSFSYEAGAGNGTCDYKWDGMIDEVHIYNTLRTDAAAWIKASFNSGNDSLVTYGTEKSSTSWTETGSYGAEAFNHPISSLTCGTTYYFRAKAKNSAGWGYGSNAQFTTSVCIVPPTITTNAASLVEATTATGNGYIDNTGNEDATKQVVEWGMTSGGPYPNSATNTGSYGTGAFTKSMTGLNGNATYYYRAKAYNSSGWGYGGQQSFVTKAGCFPRLGGASHTIDTTCTFGGGGAGVFGVENGNLTIDTDKTLTINAGQTVVWNPGYSIFINGQIAIDKTSPGGQIRKAHLWYVDTNSDGYPDSLNPVAATTAVEAASAAGVSESSIKSRLDSAFTSKWTYVYQMTLAPSYYALSCQVRTSCLGGEASLLRISATGNAHAELPAQAVYANHVCCSATGATAGNSCSGGYSAFLKLSGATNAHVEKKTQSNYANSACLSSSAGNVTCDYSTDCSSLGEGYTCLASISGDTNAHVGDCAAYSTKVCCRITP